MARFSVRPPPFGLVDQVLDRGIIAYMYPPVRHILISVKEHCPKTHECERKDLISKKNPGGLLADT
jgi:hypothetical protein